jgi:hypothetical protein
MFGSNELIFSRVLNVTTRGLSKLYGFYIIPTITQIENIGGKKVQSVDGTKDFGNNIYI